MLKDQSKQTEETAGDLEEITNNLCHLVGTSPAALAVCAPVYYAGLLCKRALCHVRRDGKGDATTRAPGTLEVNKKYAVLLPIPVLVVTYVLYRLEDTMFYI